MHGVLYIIYIIFAYILAQKLKMKTGPTVLLLLAGTVPIMTFFVERWMNRTYIAPALAAESAPSETAARRAAGGPSEHTITSPRSRRPRTVRA